MPIEIRIEMPIEIRIEMPIENNRKRNIIHFFILSKLEVLHLIEYVVIE